MSVRTGRSGRGSHAWVVGLAACCCLAGCSGSGSGPAAESPQSSASSAVGAAAAGDGDDLQARVLRRDLRLTFRLDGVSARGLSVPVSIDPSLVLDTTLPARTAVEQGQQVGTSRISAQVLAALEVAAEQSPLDKATLDRLKALQGPVRAPLAGVLDRVEGQVAVASAGLDVVAPLTPLQELRFRSTSFAGAVTVETVLGTRTVACSALWTVAGGAAAGGGTAGGAPDGAVESSTDLHCRLPQTVESAPGLRARVRLESKPVKGVLVVPNLALTPTAAGDGFTVTVRRNGAERQVPVTVGLTDGVVRVVTGGDVAEGDELVLAAAGQP